MKLGDEVAFTDKTGEKLTGKLTATNWMGDDNILVASCFKPSWDMEVSCLVEKKYVTITNSMKSKEELSEEQLKHLSQSG